MKCKIEQSRNEIVAEIKEGSKKSILSQRTENDNRTHIMYEFIKETDNMKIIKRIEYIF